MPYSEDLYYHVYHPEDTDRLPLVLIHGAGGNHLHWPVHLRRLSGCRVYALDLPGHGKSNGHGLQNIGDYARHVLAWMDSIRLPRVVLAGHSMGGAIALWLAAHHPSRVRGLILISTGSRLPVHPSLLTDTAQPATFQAAVEKIIDWSFADSTDRKIVQLAREHLLEVRPAVLHGDFLACDAVDLTEQLEDVSAPALVIWGAEDRMTPLRFSETLAARLPAAALEKIPRAGHMVIIERPAQVADLVKSFCDRLEGQGSKKGPARLAF